MSFDNATARLRAEDPPLGIALDEAICPRCNLAFFVGERAFSWGVCPDCVGEALEPVQVDKLDPPGYTPPLF